LTPQCKIPRGNDFKFEYLIEFLVKKKIVPEYLSWGQEELFDTKKPTLKNLFTLSL